MLQNDITRMAAILSKAPILCRTAFQKKLIFGPITKIILVKNQGHLTNRTNIRAEQRFRLKDNISDDYRLIYREQKFIEAVCVISYNSGWIGLALGSFLAAYLVYEDPPVTDVERPGFFNTLKPLTKVGRIIMLIGGFVICVLLLTVSRTMPLRIYHSSTQKMYKMIIVDNIFRGKKMLTFGEGTVTQKFKRSGFTLGALYDINGHTILLDIESFPVQSMREQMIRKTN